MTRFRSFLILMTVAACGGSTSPASAPGPGPGPGDTGTTAAAQVEDGAELYGRYCADCHGADGSGSAQAPALVGPGALALDPPAAAEHRQVQFGTAHDVFAWVADNMPADDPGSLSGEQYAAILAFALTANGVELTAPLDAAAARVIVLHPGAR